MNKMNIIEQEIVMGQDDDIIGSEEDNQSLFLQRGQRKHAGWRCDGYCRKGI